MGCEQGGQQLDQASSELRDGHLVVLVAHTVDEDDEGTEVLRIISARKADSEER